MGTSFGSRVLVVIVLVAVAACSGPSGPGSPSGAGVVVKDAPVVVTLPSGGTVTIPPLPAGESAVVTVEESALPFTGEFAPLQWLTQAVSITTDDDVEWAEDSVFQLSLPLTGSPAVSTQSFDASNSVGVIRVAGAPDDVFGIPSSVFYAKPRLNSSTGFIDMDLSAGFMLSSSSTNARDVEVRIAGNVIAWRKTFWPAQEGVFRVVPAEVPSQRDEFVDECGLNNLDALPARLWLLAAIADADTVHLSAATYVEVGAFVDAARDPIASRRFDELLELFQVVIEPVTAPQARRARDACRDFGRGSGHSAQLTYGDVFSYALATDLRVPLLFKGDDFTHTDVSAAGA